MVILRWYHCGPCDLMWRDHPDGSSCWACEQAGSTCQQPDLRGPSHYEAAKATEVA